MLLCELAEKALIRNDLGPGELFGQLLVALLHFSKLFKHFL